MILNHDRSLRTIPLIILAIVLLACRAEQQARLPQPSSSPTTVPLATATATLTPTPQPSDTPTATPTSSPTATLTPTPTPSPTPLHPLTIAWLRQHPFPASQIVLEETLEPGDNYTRAIVSYQSEGSQIYALLTVPTGDKPSSGWPVIVFNHGFIPPAQYRTTERYVAYVDTIARHGYIVFRSDYRGHGSSEGEATGGYGSPA